ncbi:hypothetical protein Tco_0669085 [Tanacetum coccineum]
MKVTPSDAYSDGTLFGGVTDWYLEPRFVKGECGTPAGRVILFGTIPTTIPDTTPTFDPPEDPSSDHIPSLPATLPFLLSTDDSLNSDTPDTPPSPTHGTPFTEITLSTQRSPAASGALRRRVMILALGQPIPHGRPCRYHPNGPVHMMTARKRIRPLPTHRFAMRHSVDYSSSDPFTFDYSSETSSDSSSDDLSDSSSSHSTLDHSSPALPSGTRSSHQLCSSVPSIPHSSVATTERPSHSSFAGPSRKRSRSPTTSAPRSSPIPGALSPTRVDLLPPPKRIRSSDSATNLEDCLDESSELSIPRETSLRDDAKIGECIAYADALRAEGIDARVLVEVVAREEVETSTRGRVKVRVERVTHPAVPDDVPDPAQKEGVVEVTYETLGDLSVVLSERISELKRDNTRLRGTLDVASQRVSRLQRRELRVRREIR